MMNAELENSQVSKKECGRLETIHTERENELVEQVHTSEEIFGMHTDFPDTDKSQKSN